MHTACRAAVVVVVGGLAAGCSETGFQDFFGAGKYAPDETQVSTNEPLAVPPDLQLRPPSDEPPPRRSASRDTQSFEQQDLATAPGADEAPSADEAPREAAPQPYEPTQQAQPQQLQSQPQQQASAEPQDAYERWGVSRYHPDGREKTQIELHAEMRQKKLERERQKDPNYGTIWNMESIWSDG